MAFDHVSTFLRSALVRDPFSLGGIIGPEDVLRLERKYPTLFDKPPNSTSESDTILELERRKEKVENVKTTTIAERASSPEINLKPPKRSMPVKAKLLPVGMKAKPQRKPVPVVSQFHRKCLGNEDEEKPVRLRNSPGKRVIKKEHFDAGSGRRRTLSRPAQSFSLEDLRETLKKVMEEDSKALRASSKPVKKSPYTQDLVKLFLGRKLEELNKRRMSSKNFDSVKTSAAGMSRSQSQTQAISKETHIAGERSKATSSPSRKKVKKVRSAPGFLRGATDLPRAPQQKKRIPCSRYTTKNVTAPKDKPDSSEMDRGESVKHVSWSKDTEKGGESQSRETDEFAVIPFSDTEETDEFLNSGPAFGERRVGGGTQIFLRSREKLQLDRIPAPKTVVRDTRFRHLARASESGKWETKGLLRKEETQNNFYEKQMEKQAKNPVQRKESYYNQSHRYTPPETQADILVDSETARRKTHAALEKIAEEMVYMEILHQLKEIKQEQEDQDAKDERKIHQNSKMTKSHGVMKPGKEKSNSNSLTTSLSSGSQKKTDIALPEFVPTTDYESESKTSGKEKQSSKSKSVSPSKIVLKTPELTPPPTSRKTFTQGKNKSENVKEKEKKEEIILNTPDLSPSPRKVAAQKLIQIQEMEVKAKTKTKAKLVPTETDCSDMSDFVLSESAVFVPTNPASARSEKENAKVIPVKKSESPRESIKLDTPRLSQSYHQSGKKSKSKSKESEREEREPEMNASTLSGVSTFEESHNSEQLENEPRSRGGKSEEKNDTQVENISQQNASMASSKHSKASKYSDDFIAEDDSKLSVHEPDKSQKSHSTPIPDSKDIESDNENDEQSESAHVELNVSGETVIDLLSEGEFLADAYRSPGEWSFRHTLNQIKQPKQNKRLEGKGKLKGKSVESKTFSNSVLEEGQEIPLPPSATTSLVSSNSVGSVPSMKNSSKKDNPNIIQEIEGQSEISHISSGAQILDRDRGSRDISLGQYLID